MAMDTLLQTNLAVRMLFVGFITFAVLVIIPRFIRFVRIYRKFQGLPGETNFSILFGNLHMLPKNGEDRLVYGRRNMDERNSRYCRMWFGPFSPVILFYHPETVKLVLKSSAPKSRGFGAIYEHAVPWIGEGLIAANGPKWSRARRLLTPAFHFDVLRSYFDVYNQAVETLMKKMDHFAETGESFDLCPLMTLCTLEVILKCAMGYDMDIQRYKEHPYAQAVRELLDCWSYRARHLYLWPDFIFQLTELGRRFKRNCNYVHKVSSEVIEKRKHTLATEGPSKHRHLDFLDILLTARDEDGNPLTTEEIRNEVDTFMFAGHDTTATSIPWILHALAKHPEYQEKVQAEVDSMLEGRDSDYIHWSDISKLETLPLCIKEALRLYPTVPFIQRTLNEDIVVEGVTVPAGYNVTIAIIHLHRNADIWDRPDDFCPERFEPQNKKGVDNYAFIPFSAGSRNCIGQHFALNQEKAVISRILRRYTMEVAPDGPPVRRNAQAVLKSESGLYFRVKRRNI